jgi:hypothetical protein
VLTTTLPRPSLAARRIGASAGWTGAILLISVLASVRYLFYWQLERWDDAYITFRFAQHLAAGEGLIWNLGGERVEGYSSLLHVLLLTLPTAVGISPWVSSLLVGTAGVAVTAAALVHVLRRTVGGLHAAGALAVGLYLFDEATAVHAMSGLETQLFVALLACKHAASLAFAVAPALRAGLALAGASFLAVLARPEAVLYVGTTYGVLWMQVLFARADRHGRWRALAASTALLLVAGAGYAAWKVAYFGYLLPNPFYVKSARLDLSGALPVAAFAGHLALRLGIPAALVAVLARDRIPRLLARCADASVVTPILLTLAPPLLALAYYTTIFHEMGEFYRFPYPTYFYFVVAAGAAMTVCVRSASSEGDARVPAAPHPRDGSDRQVLRSGRSVGALALLYLAAAVVLDRPWQLGPRAVSEYFAFHERIASALHASGLGARGVVLCDSAGLIPYTSGFTHVDRVGLVENKLSGRWPITLEERERDIWTRRLDVYIGFEPPAHPGAERADDDPRLQGRYGAALLRPWFGTVMERILLNDADMLHRRMRGLRDRWIWVGDLGLPRAGGHGLKAFAYVRRDSPYARLLLRELEKIVVRRARDVDLDALNAQ